MFIELWVEPTIEASVKDTVVYRSVEKALFTGTTQGGLCMVDLYQGLIKFLISFSESRDFS